MPIIPYAPLTMEREKVPTLVKNFPDVFLALLKRMNPSERKQILSEFERDYPKDFQKWNKPDVQSYIRSLDT